MGVEVIEGVLEPGQPRSTKRGYARFDRLKIITANGQVREVAKVATAEPVTSEALRGGQGKYYFVTADGPMGLYGVRRPDGAKVYAHFTNVEPLILVVGILGTICAIARFGLGYENFPLLASILGPLLLIGWFYLSTKRKNARRFFEADD